MPRTLGLPIPARPLTSLLRALAALVGRPQADRYRPERHYMRGPGPKCRAKSGAAEPS
jgi:hypothetical protein